MPQTLSEYISCLLIHHNFTPEHRLIHELNLLQHSVTILNYLLIHKHASVDIVFHKLFRSTKLYMLIHQFGDIVTIIDVIYDVFLHLCILISRLAKA